MKGRVISSYFFTCMLMIISHLNAQEAEKSDIQPVNVVLVKQKIVKEIQPNYDSLIAATKPEDLIQYQEVYMPVAFDEKGRPIKFEYVKVPVSGAPNFPNIRQEYESLSALISLPAKEDLVVSKVYFSLGNAETTEDFDLLKLEINASDQTQRMLEFIQGQDYNLIIIQLGKPFEGIEKFNGMVVIEDDKGNLCSPFKFSSQ